MDPFPTFGTTHQMLGHTGGASVAGILVLAWRSSKMGAETFLQTVEVPHRVTYAGIEQPFLEGHQGADSLRYLQQAESWHLGQYDTFFSSTQ